MSVFRIYLRVSWWEQPQTTVYRCVISVSTYTGGWRSSGVVVGILDAKTWIFWFWIAEFEHFSTTFGKAFLTPTPPARLGWRHGAVMRDIKPVDINRGAPNPGGAYYASGQ